MSTSRLDTEIPTDHTREPGTRAQTPLASQSQRLVSAVVEHGLLEADDTEHVRRIHQQSPERSLAAILVDQGVNELELMKLMATMSGIPLLHLNPEIVDTSLVELLGSEFLPYTSAAASRTRGPPCHRWNDHARRRHATRRGKATTRNLLHQTGAACSNKHRTHA